MQGSINLKTCSEIKMIGVYKKKKDCFTMVTPSKTYFLYGCEGDSESWVKALNDAKGSAHRLQFNLWATHTNTHLGGGGGDAKPVDTPPSGGTKEQPKTGGEKGDTTKTVTVQPTATPVSSKDIKCLFDMSKHVLPQGNL